MTIAWDRWMIMNVDSWERVGYARSGANAAIRLYKWLAEHPDGDAILIGPDGATHNAQRYLPVDYEAVMSDAS